MLRGNSPSDLGREGFSVEARPRLLHLSHYRQAFPTIRASRAECRTAPSTELMERVSSKNGVGEGLGVRRARVVSCQGAAVKAILQHRRMLPF